MILALQLSATTKQQASKCQVRSVGTCRDDVQDHPERLSVLELGKLLLLGFCRVGEQ